MYVEMALLLVSDQHPKFLKYIVADTLQFIFQENGVHQNMHYLDYLEHQTHNKALQLAMDWCNRLLGVLIAESTTEDPAECIVGLR